MTKSVTLLSPLILSFQGTGVTRKITPSLLIVHTFSCPSLFTILPLLSSTKRRHHSLQLSHRSLSEILLQFVFDSTSTGHPWSVRLYVSFLQSLTTLSSPILGVCLRVRLQDQVVQSPGLSYVYPPFRVTPDTNS